ncbi:Multidrug resistance-associated protein 1 [Nymphon striatum]|nr:Multidrug resistance-associated protein 1 [Nymphon striatum]
MYIYHRPHLANYCLRICDYDLVWNGDYPDLTTCFQNTILAWVPLGFLIICSPFILFQKGNGNNPTQWSTSVISKLLADVCLAALAIVEVIWMTVYADPHSVSTAMITAAGLRIFTYVSIIFTGWMIWIERKNGSVTSATLFYFRMFQFIASFVSYYSMTIRLLNTVSIAETSPPLTAIDVLKKSLDKWLANIPDEPQISGYTAMRKAESKCIRHMLPCVKDSRDPNLEDVTLYGLQLASTPLVLLQLFLTFIADIPSSYTSKKECPETHSSYVSQLVFGWIDPMLVLGYKEPLTREKLWDLTPSNTSHDIVAQFDSYWDIEMQKAEKTGWDITKKKETQPKSVYMPSFLFALIKCFWGDFLIAIVQKTISDLLTFVNPQMLNLIISFVSSNDPLWKGILYALIVFVSAELQSLFMSQYFIRMYVMAMKMRMAIIAAVYRKALKMTSKERQGSTVGEIVNLMAIDTQRFVDLMPYVIMLYSGPLQIALSLYFLSEVIGISVVGGVAVMVLLVPVNAFIATISRKLQFKDMKFKDERTKLMNEILNGIKVLKLYAWEVPFGEMVQGIRNKEVNVLKTLAYYMAGITFVWTCAPFMVSLASFTMFVLIDEKNILTANVAFVSLSLFNLLRFPLNMLPSLITYLIQVSVSITRLNKYLRGEEINETDISHHHLGDESITIENGDFSWGGAEDGKTLADINLSVPHGQLVAVVGQVGAGKSSLISAILGEMNKQNGKINIQGSIAYVPQQAWIQNATIKDNILMYKPNKPKFYDQILEACALKSDLEILPGGDQIEIGEKGINLSGGQKQRVSLARAVYHNSNIYLLDDPLSAVDSHVGKHIFDEVIGPTGILKDKTRIFVTNGISYLPQCDTVLVLKDGLISETGSYEELLSKKGAFSDFLVNYLTQDQSNIDERDLEHIDEILAQVPGGEIIQRQISKRYSGSESEGGSESSSKRKKSRAGSSTRSISSRKSITPSIPVKKADGNKLTQVEKMETAEVKIGVYVAYLRRIGIPMGITILLMWVAAQASSVGSNVWLSEWSNDPVNPDGTADAKLRDMRLGVYGALGVAQGNQIVHI